MDEFKCSTPNNEEVKSIPFPLNFVIGLKSPFPAMAEKLHRPVVIRMSLG